MIVKTVEEIEKYVVIDGSFSIKTLVPYLEPVHEKVKDILGMALYVQLHDYYNATDPEVDADLDKLLPYAQRPIILFAFLQGIDQMNVSIGNNGIGVVSTSTIVPASKERVASLKVSIETSAYDALELLLEFLEANHTVYPDWKQSDAFMYQYQYLISSARKFDELYRINRSRHTFLDWRPLMADIEMLTIAPMISEAFLQELKSQIKEGTVSEANAKILPLLQKALAYLTAAIHNDNVTFARGQHYLMQAKKLLDADPESYPTFMSSDAYVVDRENYTTYDNDEDLGIAAFG